jgi:hypothetical protein
MANSHSRHTQVRLRSTGTQTARLTHDDCEDITSDPEVEDVDMEDASERPAANNSSEHRRPHETDALQQFATRIRENVLRTGYFETAESWRSSHLYAGLPSDLVRALSLRFARWCRDLALVFERHGAARSREIIHQMGDDMCSAGFWNEMVILDAWVEARRAAEDERHLLAGWVTQTWENVSAGRASRITRLSLDGQTDPLHESTNFDADFAHMYGPLLGPTPPEPTAGRNNSGTVVGSQDRETRRSGTPGTSNPSNGAFDPTPVPVPHPSSTATAPDTTANTATTVNDTTGGVPAETGPADSLPPLMRNLVVSSHVDPVLSRPNS